MTPTQAATLTFLALLFGLIGACITAICGVKAFATWDRHRGVGVFYATAGTSAAALTVGVVGYVWGVAL